MLGVHYILLVSASFTYILWGRIAEINNSYLLYTSINFARASPLSDVVHCMENNYQN